MMTKILEYALLISAIVLMSREHPYWCILAIVFMAGDLWNYTFGYIRYKEHMRKTIIKLPKDATEKQKAEIIEQKIKELMEDE